MNRTIASGLTSALLVGGLAVGTSSASAAPMGCTDAGHKGYTISDKSTVYPGTNLFSDWVPDTNSSVSYEHSATGTLTASGTAGVEAEAGAIFAKASTSFSVTVGKSWSHSQSWTYTLHPTDKAGKKWVRMRLFHEAKKFKAQKWIVVNQGGACKTQTVWTKWFTAPVTKNSNYWNLEYK
ncbi:hypothetical protein [Streptomyces sp. NRRL S-646]|uniref:hypothetical protein n=1 Tax=Streptomyces sp. NRRL S-646 TaxID=1463917 RepID=UPI0004C4E43C|nr:hypothetical protein [Streptomyces sp. NRRL S-646]